MKFIPENVADLATHPQFFTWMEPQRMMFEMAGLTVSTR